jgi:hypothetical protein
VPFDFVIARSIWTHASKRQILSMLDAFRDAGAPASKFLASFLPARPIGAAPGSKGKKAFWIRDYEGDDWVGASHERKRGGLVGHRWSWVKQACGERGLQAEMIPGEKVNRQRWARISRT